MDKIKSQDQCTLPGTGLQVSNPEARPGERIRRTITFWSISNLNPQIPFFLLLIHQIWHQNVYLLPKMSHAHVTLYLFNSLVSGYNVMPDLFITDLL